MVDLLTISAASPSEDWARVTPLLHKLADLSHGRLSAHHIAHAVLKGKMQMWVAEHDGGYLSALLTEIIVWPTGHKEANIFAATGKEVSDWLPHFAKLEAWARAAGCASVRADHCRSGWRTVLAPLGFTEGHFVLEKKL